MRGTVEKKPNTFEVECMLKQIRMTLEIQKERKIFVLQKYELKLKERLETPGISLADVKVDLQLCVINYQRIKAMALIKNYISFLEDKSLLITKAFDDPSVLKELLIMMKGVGWGLYKMNSDLAPMYLNFFARIVGDVTKLDNQVDRQLYFLLAWAIPQDLESIKYLRGFLDRNNIPVSTIDHHGWFGPNMDAHIKQMELAEISKSKMRSNFKGPANPPHGPAGGQSGAGAQPPKGPNDGHPAAGAGGAGGFGAGATLGGTGNPAAGNPNPFSQDIGAPASQSQGLPPQQPTNLPPAFPTDQGPFNFGGVNVFQNPSPATSPFPPAPLNECTQAELGIETGEKYQDGFDKDLEFLKQDFGKMEKDPKTSEMFNDIKRREALKPEDAERAFFDALNAIKASEIMPVHATDGVKNDNLPNPYNIYKETDPGAFTFGVPDHPQNHNVRTDSVFLPTPQPPAFGHQTPFDQPPVITLPTFTPVTNLPTLTPVTPPYQAPLAGAGGMSLTPNNHVDIYAHGAVQNKPPTPADPRQLVNGPQQPPRAVDKDFISLLKRVGV